MPLDRRAFLASSAAASALALWGREPRAAPKPLRILILGGTGFIGPALTQIALDRGHTVSFFNRNKTNTGLFPQVTRYVGDRDPKLGEGLKALEGHDWDVVIDDSGYFPRQVSASATLLAGHVHRYIYISSIACYKDPHPLNGDENAPLGPLADPTVETMGPGGKNYGGLKALCEQALTGIIPADRLTIVRPGYLVGPGDTTGRFTYWPVRFDKGGEIAVPGLPTDPIQIMDVRDLSAFLVKLAEDGANGRFNVVGPQKRMEWAQVIQACAASTAAKSTPIWMDPEFISQQTDIVFPIWNPFQSTGKNMHTWRNDRAVQAGLRFLPVETTAKDTLRWYKGLAPDDRLAKLAGPSAEQEAKLIATWKALHAAKSA